MPTYEVMVTSEFSAAHQLRLADGRLEPLHGHNWTVEIFLTGPQLDSMGILADFTVIRAQLDQALRRWHDRFLNDMPEFAEVNPSAENVARHLHETLAPQAPEGARIAKVRVWEAIGCAAAYVAEPNADR